MKSLIQYLLYRSPIAGMLYRFAYRKWLKRYRKQDGFLSGDKLHAYLPASSIYQYHAEEKVVFNRPRYAETSKALPKQIDFYVDKTFTVSAGEVYHFDNAFLIGENAVGVTHDGQIILDTVMDLPNVLPKCSPRLLMKYDRLKTDVHFDRVLSLVHIFCNNHYVNYFHWLTDSLLLLEGAEAYERKYGVPIKILVNEKLKPFQKQYFELLGIKEDQLVYWKDYKKANVKELIVVKSRRTGTNMDEIVSPQGVRWLRERVVQHLPSKLIQFNKRVFLSRQNTNCRRIVNFEELKPLLEKYDFQIVDAEDLNIAEQVQLFKSVEVLFTVHGAGLTNIIFSEKLQILELIGNVDRPNDFQWYCAYYSMSQALNLDYSFLECDIIPLLQPELTKQIYDVKVDLNQIEERLNLLLSNTK
jgi:hypothetical protein